MEIYRTHQSTQTCSRQHSGWSGAPIQDHDPQHTALLQTTGDCLGGKTFRAKITSYGNFRNGTVWASNDCQGNCSVQYGGQLQTTDGFRQATCSGSLQSATQVGFWCDWKNGDGAVLMIGGGGDGCERADHGIGITERTELPSGIEKIRENTILVIRGPAQVA